MAIQRARGYRDRSPHGPGAIGVVEVNRQETCAPLNPGTLVVMPFAYSDGSCAFCQESLQTSCVHGGFFGSGGEAEGAQAEALRIPQADGTLAVLPVGVDDALMASLLTLSDVMGTGPPAARVANVREGSRVVVIGDGAVGLCGVLAARRLGAEQIIIMGRHPDRIALAKDFGATDVVSERGEPAAERVRELTGGFGAHSVLECVGSEQASKTAVSITPTRWRHWTGWRASLRWRSCRANLLRQHSHRWRACSRSGVHR